MPGCNFPAQCPLSLTPIGVLHSSVAFTNKTTSAFTAFIFFPSLGILQNMSRYVAHLLVIFSQLPLQAELPSPTHPLCSCLLCFFISYLLPTPALTCPLAVLSLSTCCSPLCPVPFLSPLPSILWTPHWPVFVSLLVLLYAPLVFPCNHMLSLLVASSLVSDTIEDTE